MIRLTEGTIEPQILEDRDRVPHFDHTISSTVLSLNWDWSEFKQTHNESMVCCFRLGTVWMLLNP